MGSTETVTPTYNRFFNVKENVDNSVSFSTSTMNSSIATVSGTTIYPQSTGKTQVVISGGDRQATVEVTVLGTDIKAIPQVGTG